MTKTILAVTMLLTLSSQVMAAKYQSKSAPSRNPVSDADFTKAWNSSSPACVKEKNSLLYVNKAFIAKNLKFGDCTDTSTTSVKFTKAQLTASSLKLAEQN